MTNWEYPYIGVFAFFLTVVTFILFFGYADVKGTKFGYECGVCGARYRGLGPKSWRYCPACGAPKNATSYSEIPDQGQWEFAAPSTDEDTELPI